MQSAVEDRPKSELAALWSLALPLALAQAGQALMGMVDTAVLGRLSPAAQAGAGLGNSLTFTCTFFGMGVMLALDPLVSQAIGAGEQAKARTHYWQGVWLALFTSVLVMIPIALIPFLLEPFGVTATIADAARTYMWWRLPGVAGVLLFVGAKSYLTGVNRVAITLIAMVVANIANLLLDLGLVFGAGPIPALGVTGAAIATVLCTWVQFSVLLLGFGKPPEGRSRAFDRVEVMKAFKLGAPIGLHFIAESGLFSLTGVLAGRLGENPGAAHQVALNWASLTFCVASGIGSAAATRVGWAVGREDAVGARKAGLTAFASVVVFMCFGALIFIVFPNAMASLMSSEPDVVAVAASLFTIVAVFQLSDGVQAVGAGALRGTGDVTFTFWANIIGHWGVGLPVAWWLGVRGPYGVQGLWWGLFAGLSVVAVALLARFAMTTRKPIARLA
ncbi:MAG: MATE family efflux transporter [Archangium sp.]|nr:MATE family efflux transporter [Archangium sp.]